MKVTVMIELEDGTIIEAISGENFTADMRSAALLASAAMEEALERGEEAA